MASEGGGKIKSKRGHSSTKPYERRKSLLSRITDSIKEVLRPSWLAADDGQSSSSATGDRPISSVSEEDDEFVSPVQSPSQLPGNLGLGVGTGETSQPGAQHGDATHCTGDSSVQWLQRPRLSPTWENRSRATKTTWGNSASTFDKSQFSRSFFSQRHAGNRLAENAVETSSRGLGGVGPASTSSGPSSTLTSASALERLGRSTDDARSLATAVHSRQQRSEERTDRVMVSATVTSSSMSESVAEENPSKRLRLWSPENLHKRQSQEAYRPAFKISVFSSPRLNQSAHESSFYSGKTMYGGASAYRRSSLNSSLPYKNALPIRKSVTAKPMNNSGNAVLSSSATQILKTLERLSDTKRSRIDETDTESLLSFTPTSYRKPSRPLQTTLPSRSLEVPARGPPIHHRQSPVVASIAKNPQIVSLPLQRPQPASSPFARRTEEHRRDENVESEEEEVIGLQEHRTSVVSEIAEPAPSRSSGKMKHQKSYDTRGRNRKPSREDDEVQEVPNLRTDFTLPIASMPAFSLGLPAFSNPLAASASASTSKTNSGSPVSKATSASTLTKSNPSPPKLQFTFSSPIHKSAPGSTQPPSSPVTDFHFSSPLKVSDSVSADRRPSPATTAGFSFASPLQNTTPAWGSTEARPKSSKTVCAENSKASSVGQDKVTSPVTFGLSTGSPSVSPGASFGGPLKPASQLKSGSVMDILGKSPSSSTLPAFKAAGELKQGSVMDVLGGKNDGKLATSPPSAGLKPAAQLKQGSVMDILGKQSSSGSPSGTDSLLAKFAPPSGSWECPVCMIQNAADANKCVACTAARPAQQKKEAARSGVSGQSSGSKDSLFAQFAPPAGSWECQACMVQNKGEADKCVACQTRRPAPAASSSASKSSTSGADSLFSKFAPAAGSWECDACMLQNKPDATKCVACETPKPGAAASSSAKSSTSGADSLFSKFAPAAGSWECDACMLQNKSDATKCVACETPRPGAAAASSSAKSSTSGADSLFSKFAPAAGSWECDACMLQNKPDATKCVACETPKPGAVSSSSSSGPSDTLMAKFKKPAGSWDCDVCLVQNTAAHTTCVACQSPRPGTMSTGVVPPPAPTAQAAPGGRLTFDLPSTSTGPSPFLAACSSSAQSSSAGFSFTPATTPSSAPSMFGGVQLGSGSGSKAPPASGGFKFGQDTSNSASTLPSQGLSFGAKNSSPASATGAADSTTVLSSSSGFQFGTSSASSTASSGGGFVFGSSLSGSAAATTTTTTTAAAVTVSGFTFGSTAGAGGFQFGTAPQTSSPKLGDSKSEAGKLTTGGSVTRTEGLIFSPVFGAGKPSNSFALGAAPSVATGSVSSVTTGGFQFQAPASTIADSTTSPFPAGIASSPAAAGNDSLKTQSGGAAGKPSLPGGFSFSAPVKSNSDAASKPEALAPAKVDSLKKNGVSSIPSSSTSQGFVFGAASSGSSIPPNLFSSVPQLGSAAFTAPSAPKLPVNGEVGGPPPFSFGQPPASKAPATGGFSFGAPVGGKDSGSTSNPLAPAKPFSFGTDAAALGKPASEKRHLDNDVGPSAKKRVDLTGSTSTGGSEGFKFGNTASSAGSNLFKFSQTSQGSQEKGVSPTTFGGQASGFGASTQGGFTFSLQSNAASSTGGQQASSVFGAGAGTGTGQFSFGLAAGSQSNAAAASPFGSDAPAPTQGFNFAGATQPSFNFGANSANTSAPVFQFGSSQSGDPAPAQPAAGGMFVFGQTAPSADSSAPTAPFTPANPPGFGAAAPAQTNFNIGTGDGQRKIKRAVRRTVRK